MTIVNIALRIGRLIGKATVFINLQCCLCNSAMGIDLEFATYIAFYFVFKLFCVRLVISYCQFSPSSSVILKRIKKSCD